MLSSAGPALGVPCFTCTEEPRTGPSAPGEASSGLARAGSPQTAGSALADVPPDTICLLGHKGTTGSWTDCCSPGPTVPSPQTSVPAGQTVSSFQQVIFTCFRFGGKKTLEDLNQLLTPSLTPTLQLCRYAVPSSFFLTLTYSRSAARGCEVSCVQINLLCCVIGILWAPLQ